MPKKKAHSLPARELLVALQSLRREGFGGEGSLAKAHRTLGASDAEVEAMQQQADAVHEGLMGALRDLHAAVTPSSPLLTEDVIGRASDALDRARAMQEVQALARRG